MNEFRKIFLCVKERVIKIQAPTKSFVVCVCVKQKRKNVEIGSSCVFCEVNVMPSHLRLQ